MQSACSSTGHVRRLSNTRAGVPNTDITILGLERDSSDLVVGDIVNLLEPPLSLLPADLFLLSGDAIVNESMLTGESVPVSKIPVRDEDLARWREAKDVDSNTAKSFLYAGTRVVRIRKGVGLAGELERPALGMVVRTGEPRFRDIRRGFFIYVLTALA